LIIGQVLTQQQKHEISAELKAGTITGSQNGRFSIEDTLRVCGWIPCGGLAPKPGDHRVRFECCPGATVSVWGQQKFGGILCDYLHGASIRPGTNIDLIGQRHHIIKRGDLSLGVLLQEAEHFHGGDTLVYSVGIFIVQGMGLYVIGSFAGSGAIPALPALVSGGKAALLAPALFWDSAGRGLGGPRRSVRWEDTGRGFVCQRRTYRLRSIDSWSEVNTLRKTFKSKTQALKSKPSRKVSFKNLKI